jgi:hypothetical protein
MAVLMLITTMVLFMGAVFMMTTGEARAMKRSLDRLTAIAYADGVLECLFDQWRAAMSNSTNLTQSEAANGLTGAQLLASPFSIAAPSSTVLPVPANMTLASWSVNAADPYGNTLSGTSPPIQENGTNSSLLKRMYYTASATVTFPHGQVTVQRTFTRAGKNVFNNFLFSAQPVTEMEPGQAMYVNGTVYANGNLYLDSSSLTLQQDVSYTGSLFTGTTAPNDTHGLTGGTPTEPANDPPHLGTTQMLINAITSEFDANYIGAGSYSDPGIYSSTNSITADQNDKGYHELIEQQHTPLSSNADPLQIDSGGDNERLANNADYTITVDVNNNVAIYSGTNTTAMTGSGTTATAYNAIMGALITNTALYDGRVGDTVRLLTVDVGEITAAYNAGQIIDNNYYEGVKANDGLLLYIADLSWGTSATTNGYAYNLQTTGTNGLRTTGTNGSSSHVTSSFARGIRLVNGGSLPAGQAASSTNGTGGLTIASPNPVYIQGDYNTGSTISGTFSSSGVTYTNTPPSDASTAYPSGTSAPTPVATVSGTTYNRQASVVAADAITILSNAWSDANSNAALSSRNPANTTINTAIVAGNVPTAVAGTYSGGIENFPRLLENWNQGGSAGEYLTIYGSFALLYNSEQATQQWQTTGAYYQAPSRRWFFDSATLQNNNPPGFPSAFSYTRGRWQTQ